MDDNHSLVWIENRLNEPPKVAGLVLHRYLTRTLIVVPVIRVRHLLI